jgi:hypothetical protein
MYPTLMVGTNGAASLYAYSGHDIGLLFVTANGINYCTTTDVGLGSVAPCGTLYHI